MKPFKSFLAPKMDEFLAYRESLGYSLKTLRYHLLILDQYVRDKNADRHSLQPAFFLEMRVNLKMEPSSVNTNLSAARTFFQFLVRRGYYKKNPLQDIPHLKRNAVVPFIFTPEQTDQLLEAMCKRFHKTKGYFLRDLAVYMALLLLARCGMRISEPLKLQRNHYRSDDRTIYIEKTKFSKDRLIPLPQMVATQLENYLSVRTSLIRNDQSPYLLVQGNQRPLSDYQVHHLFHISLNDIGLEQPRRVIENVNFLQPTPHSLRHAFAVNTLLKIKGERGGDPQNALPILAAYMGHSEYKYTSVYLRVTDALSRKQLIDFTLWQEEKE
jgi:integrase/recombinase XerD